MEKYFHLNTEQEEDTGGASFDVDTYTFLSSSPVGFPSLQSIIQHKPLLLFNKKNNNPYQTTSPISSHPSLIFKVPKTEAEELDSNQPPLFQLPNLCSLEQNLDTPESKLVTQSPYQLNSPLPSASNNQARTSTTTLKYKRQKEVARQRRQRIREKLENLKKLLPTDKKKKRVDTATVLENAGKYIKFLEAQVSVLEAMPVDDNLSLNNGLGMVDRKRVLQMIVNSEVTQGIMSWEGMCVYSVEQVVEMIGRLFTSDEASVILNSML